MALAAAGFGAGLSDEEDERTDAFAGFYGGISSSSEPEEEAEEEMQGKPQLRLDVGGDAGSALWSLISPCSEPDEGFFYEMEQDVQENDEDDKEEGRFREEEEGEGGFQEEEQCVKELQGEDCKEEGEVQEVSLQAVEDASALADVSDDESEQEQERVDAELFWAAVERESVWCQSDDDSDEEDSDEDDSRPPAPAPDVVQETSRTTSQQTRVMWTRMKARSYAGASSAGVQAAVASMKQRARTISSVGSGHKLQVDDGDFSSDDEDCQRVSEVMQDVRWRRRRPSIAFAARLSVPTPSMDSLRTASGKFGSKLSLYRSSSSNTVTSEESFLDSPNTANGEVKSAPAAFHIGAKYLPAGKRGDNVDSKSSSYSNLHVQRNLRAGVAKAAVYLNSASAEAARKFKAKTTTLRSQWHPEASETEEDETDTQASSCGEAIVVAH